MPSEHHNPLTYETFVFVLYARSAQEQDAT